MGIEKDVDKLIKDIDIYTEKKDYSKLNDIGRSLIKYSYMSELKNNKDLTINKKYKYLLDGLHYNSDFEELEKKVLEEICRELNIDKNNISFIEKNKNIQKK